MTTTIATSPNFLSFCRGDNHTVEVACRKVDPANLTRTLVYSVVGLVSATLTIRRRNEDTTVVLAKTGSIANLPGTDGKIKFLFVPADTSALAPGTYVYDVKVVLPGPLTYTVIIDEFNLKSNVGHA